MGIFFNPGNEGFRSALRSQIYVDKTGLLEYTNACTGFRTEVHLCEQAQAFRKIYYR